MRVSRTKTLKREADAIARMMTRAGMKNVTVVGKYPFWTVVARGTVRQLASFAAEEAMHDIGLKKCGGCGQWISKDTLACAARKAK